MTIDHWSDHMITPQNLSKTKPTRLQCPLHTTHQPHRSISPRVNLHVNQHLVSMSCSSRHATSPLTITELYNNTLNILGFLICFCLIIFFFLKDLSNHIGGKFSITLNYLVAFIVSLVFYLKNLSQAYTFYLLIYWRIRITLGSTIWTIKFLI